MDIARHCMLLATRNFLVTACVWFTGAGTVFAAEQANGAGSRVVEPMAAGNLVQMTLGLLAVLLLLGGLAWFMRRVVRIQGVAGGALRVIGGLSMGARERVVLIQVGKQQMLLGVAPGRVQTLHVLDEPLTELQSETGQGNFAQNLRMALGRGGQ